jgi:DNA-binding GntR family transcriptional regulator
MSRQSEATSIPAEPVTRGNLRQQVTARLMTAIFQGRFRSGQRLVVQALSRAYEASPTPVREALVELASLGLVTLLPNRGAVVQSFGPKEIREISEVRRLLEVEACRSACVGIPAGPLAALEEELLQLAALAPDQAWDRRARDVDTRLHDLIADSCGSRRLAAEVGRYLTLFRSLRDVSHQRDAWTSYSRSNDVPEHLAIVAALRAADADGAALAMDRHIRSAARTLEEVICSGPDPSAAATGAPRVAEPLRHPSTDGPGTMIDNHGAGRPRRVGP